MTVIELDGAAHNCRRWTATRTQRGLAGLPDLSLTVTLTRPWMPPENVVQIRLPLRGRKRSSLSGPAYVEAITSRKFRAVAAGTWRIA